MDSTVIETVTFKLVENVGREEFIAAAKNMNAWVSSQPGFVHRRLSRMSDGTWIEHIEWADLDAAKRAAAQIGSEPRNADFLKAIDGPSVTVMHSALEVSVN